jgi:RHS repeat-associated protein
VSTQSLLSGGSTNIPVTAAVAAGTYELRLFSSTGTKLATSSSFSVTSAMSNGIFYIHTDQLGTPRLITNQTPAIVWRWDNDDPFGGNTANDNPSGLGTFTFNLRLPGQYFDAETNNHYNYFRDYSPDTGRYIQSDLIGLRGGANTYVYVSGSPVVSTDFFGLEQPGQAWNPLSRRWEYPPSTSSTAQCGNDDYNCKAGLLPGPTLPPQVSIAVSFNIPLSRRLPIGAAFACTIDPNGNSTGFFGAGLIANPAFTARFGTPIPIGQQLQQ